MTNYAREFCLKEIEEGTEAASVWMRSKINIEKGETRRYQYEVTDKDIRKIRSLHKQGYGANTIANKIKIPSSSVVKQIKLDIKMGVLPFLTGGEKNSLLAKKRKEAKHETMDV